MIKREMREEVARIAAELSLLQGQLAPLIHRLEVLVLELRNRPPVTKGEPVAEAVTPEKVTQVHQLHREFPDLPQHRLGEITNLQQGRISEILAGKRT